MSIKILTLLLYLIQPVEKSCKRIPDELNAWIDSTLLRKPSSPITSRLYKHFEGTTAIVTLEFAKHGENIEGTANQLWEINRYNHKTTKELLDTILEEHDSP